MNDCYISLCVYFLKLHNYLLLQKPACRVCYENSLTKYSPLLNSSFSAAKLSILPEMFFNNEKKSKTFMYFITFFLGLVYMQAHSHTCVKANCGVTKLQARGSS